MCNYLEGWKNKLPNFKDWNSWCFLTPHPTTTFFGKCPIKFCCVISFYINIINTVKKIRNQWLKASEHFVLCFQICQINLYPSLNHQIETGKLEHPCLFNQLPPPPDLGFFPPISKKYTEDAKQKQVGLIWLSVTFFI